MECNCFRERYEQFTALPLPTDVFNSEEFTAWSAHRFNCVPCGEWDLLNTLARRGVDVKNYPCVHIAYHSTHPCNIHSDAWECPDMILVRIDDGFAIPIRNGGTSMLKIEYCPWCGINL